MIGARAPSNIALIKYMGKKDSSSNIPENSSISMTLSSLCTLAEMTVSRSVAASKAGKSSLVWIPEPPRHVPSELSSQYPILVPTLNDRGVQRAVQHFEQVQRAVLEIFPHFGLGVLQDLFQGAEFTLRTANTFPAASGIASSASSFAAMTLVTAAAFASDLVAFEKAWVNDLVLRRAFARISRQGSGSSCRSFEGPWVHWENEDATVMKVGPIPKMAHFVVLIQTDPKKVSSSDAHTLVRASPLWENRVERVESRIRMMMSALGSVQLQSVARIAWAEAWEMHSLFHTCTEPFTYWEPGTLEGLKWLAPMIYEHSPPIVTLDAGPNIHIIVEKSAREFWRNRLREHFLDTVILEDEEGEGASILFGISGGVDALVKL